MKKLICTLLVLALVLPVYATAENAVHKYSTMLTGKWSSAGYTNVPNSSEHCCRNLDYFIYPGTNAATLTYSSSRVKTLNTETTTVMLGDETGEVYLYISDSITNNMTVGRIMFSENGNVMMLLCEDGSSFFFVKEQHYAGDDLMKRTAIVFCLCVSAG